MLSSLSLLLKAAQENIDAVNIYYKTDTVTHATLAEYVYHYSNTWYVIDNDEYDEDDEWYYMVSVTNGRYLEEKVGGVMENFNGDLPSLLNETPTDWVHYPIWKELDVTVQNVDVISDIVEGILDGTINRDTINTPKILAMFNSYELKRVMDIIDKLK